MSRRGISTGSSFEAKYGYSRAVIDDEWIFISGTTGFDYVTGAINEDVANQTRRALATIKEVLAQAGAAFGDVVRAQIFIADQADADRVLKTYGDIVGAEVGEGVRPAATAVISRLIDDRMKVEIEITARRSTSQHDLGA
ncbi:MAG: RidA family protein [Pseudomonadota bacterium]